MGEKEIVFPASEPIGLIERTIAYGNDPLNRMTAAEYDSGLSFTYQYDAAGNRLSEAKLLDPMLPAVETAYTYDDANRIATVNNVPYTWDANGNLLNDGAYTYTYNSANQLTAVSVSGLTTGYTYNGLGDRLSQFKNGVTTHYTLDLNTGLTQVLQDGANTYLYGVNRIAQVAENQTGYFLPDALGSVRQMTDEDGDITLTQSYTPPLAPRGGTVKYCIVKAPPPPITPSPARATIRRRGWCSCEHDTTAQVIAGSSRGILGLGMRTHRCRTIAGRMDTTIP